MMATTEAQRTDGRRRPSARVDWTDFARTGPETPAGRYLRLFWHPVYRVLDLAPGRTAAIKIMDEDFTLYRGESGTPHLLAFRCAHRGTQLATGWVEGDALRCRFHGWKYDPSGQCIEQPGEIEPFCQKIRIRSCPAEEYLGLIFAYLGEGEPPPFPRYQFFEALEGIREVAETKVTACNYFNRLELHGDEIHLLFAHRGRDDCPPGEIPRVYAEETDFGYIQVGVRSNRIHVAHCLMPLALLLLPDASDPGQVSRIMWRVPVDDEHFRNFGALVIHVGREQGHRSEDERPRRAPRAAGDRDNAELVAAVLAGTVRLDDIDDRSNISSIEDDAMTIGQGVIADRAHEHLGPSDAAVIMLRNIWSRELRAMAEGRPVKQWECKERPILTDGLKERMGIARTASFSM